LQQLQFKNAAKTFPFARKDPKARSISLGGFTGLVKTKIILKTCFFRSNQRLR